MQKLLIATSNAGKGAQYRTGLAGLPIELITLKELGLGSVDETGTTFEENALLKARTYFKQSGLPCIADDGGLEIDALGGKPGVYSRRWKNGTEDVSDQELIDYTIEQMQGVPMEKRTARFTMVMVFIDADGTEHSVKTATEGYISLTPSSVVHVGVPYDSLLYIPQFNKLRSELTQEEHNQVSQRAIAIQKLKPIVEQSLA